MAKQASITTISSGYASTTQLNGNFAGLNTALSNTLSRDGSSPNTMTADFDLNNNAILNGAIGNFSNVVVAGTNLTTQITNTTNSANAAAGSATASANSATASAGSATTSGNEATASGNSATAAAASANTASTQASLATSNGQAQVALATTQANNASSSASTASTKASEAASSATGASSSASTATTQANTATSKAGEASTSASSASTALAATQAARDAALAAFDNFDDKFLGEKSSAPSTDNDGDPLAAGMLYFNTQSNLMFVYSGSAWLAAYASLAGALLVANNLSDLANAGTARGNLGVAIGSNVQAYDADLAALAGLTSAANKGIQFTGSGSAGTYDLTTAGKALLDDANNTAQRVTLGLGTAAVLNVGTSANNIVQLDGSSRLPAVNGSQLTNLPASGDGGIAMAIALG